MNTFVALLAFVVSIGVFLVNREKVRLELFERRFSIYTGVLEYALIFARSKYTNIEKNELEEKLLNCVKAFRQSKYLFNKNDRIYDCIHEIIKIISSIKKQFDERTTALTNPDTYINPLKTLDPKIEELEELLTPYLYFDSFKQLSFLSNFRKLFKYIMLIILFLSVGASLWYSYLHFFKANSDKELPRYTTMSAHQTIMIVTKNNI